MKMVTKDFDQEREDAYELLLKDVTTLCEEGWRAEAVVYALSKTPSSLP
jgi:hypothetical protein